MKWEEAGKIAAEAYGKVALWVYNNPVETDALIVLAVVGSCAWYWRRQHRLRSKAFRIIRGELMKRKDREKFHLMMFEDAILDKAMSAVADGTMTDREEAEWLRFFATQFNMDGFNRQQRHPTVVRKAIVFRLNMSKMYHSIFGYVEIPGGHPRFDLRADPNYQPVVDEIEVRRTTSMSRYV